MSIALTYVEIDIDRCSLSYGVAPCQAAIGVTGDFKCFNSLGSCQDRDNFTDEGVTLRFAIDAGENLPREIECIPSITGIEFTPAIVSLGVDLGQRATLKINFKDHPDSDTGPNGDPYLADSPPARDYDPWTQGTFWGKFRARHPYLRARAIRWIQGRLPEEIATSYPQGTSLADDVLTDQEVRHYTIDSFDGPTEDGRYSLIAKDILKLADGDRAQAPVLSNGFLSVSINNSTTSATLAPSGIGNAEYPASGYVCIGGTEICSFTRSADALTITRARFNTEAVAHDDQARVQLVLTYTGLDPGVIIADLLVNYAGVDASYIPTANWLAETDGYLGRVYTAVIPEPTSVNKIISELIEQAALSIWWDDSEQIIRLRVLRSVATAAIAFSQDDVLSDSLSVKEQPERRISRVQTYFGQINPTKKLDDLENYASSAETVDDQAEVDYGSQAIKKIFSRWIPIGGRAIAERLNDIQLGRFRDPPRRFNFHLMRYAGSTPSLGDGHYLEWWMIQDVTGAPDHVPIQISALKPIAERFEIEAEEMLFSGPDIDATDRVIILDTNINNINARTIHDQLYTDPESGDTVTIIVQDGVIIGSSSTALPAMDIGTWPAGVDVTLRIYGRIQGKGGPGGFGGGTGSPGQPSSVLAGGLALYTRTAIDLEIATGEIFGGGGGGGGGAGTTSPSVLYSGGGGGGGAGKEPGDQGGAYYSTGQPGTTEAGGAPGAAAGGAGGAGGAPGEAGNAGGAYGPFNGGDGGDAGVAIDGDSYVTVTVGPGDIRGPRVN